MSSRNGSRVVVNGFVNGAAKRRSQGPRTRSSIRKTDEESIRERLGNVPNLKEFMHKQTVIKQYRTFFRVVKLIPDEEWRVHCHNEIRTSFELNKNESSRLSRMAAVKEVCSIFLFLEIYFHFALLLLYSILFYHTMVYIYDNNIMYVCF